MNYIIVEKQCIKSYREGKQVVAKNLTEAKKRATRGQVFQDTVLAIFNPIGVLLAYKKGDKWHNLEYTSSCDLD